jgi:hypothetical protein
LNKPVKRDFNEKKKKRKGFQWIKIPWWLKTSIIKKKKGEIIFYW